MVHIAGRRRPVTARGPARHIASPHKIRQRSRRPIPGFRGTGGEIEQRAQLGLLSQLCDQVRGDQRIGAHQIARGFRTALDGGLLGHHMNHHPRTTRALPRRAIGPPATAGEPIHANR